MYYLRMKKDVLTNLHALKECGNVEGWSWLQSKQEQDIIIKQYFI